jgi:hypothetical protein
MTRAEARVDEFIYERFDPVVAILRNRVSDCRGKAQALDALCGPIGSDLSARNAPHFLGIAFEEELIEAPPKSVDDPVLERFVLTPGGKCTEACGSVTSGNSNATERTNAKYRIQGGEWVIEEGAFIEDTRLPAHVDEIRPEHACEELVYFTILGEEPVGADIESATREGHRAGKSADYCQALEHCNGCRMSDSFMSR